MGALPTGTTYGHSARKGKRRRRESLVAGLSAKAGDAYKHARSDSCQKEGHYSWVSHLWVLRPQGRPTIGAVPPASTAPTGESAEGKDEAPQPHKLSSIGWRQSQLAGEGEKEG